MQIKLNGKPIETPDGCTLADLLAQQRASAQRLAAAVNMQFVPRAEYAAYRLQPGDEVELVSPQQGG